MTSSSQSDDASSLDALLQAAEAGQERLAAALRLIVFVALLATVITLPGTEGQHQPVLAVTLVYGGLAGIGLLLAWRRYYRPFLPFVFVTAETALVVLQAVLIAAVTAMPAAMVMIMPVAGVVFVVLALAAMRYRPWLVLHAAGLFIVSMAFGQWGYETLVKGNVTMHPHPGGLHDMVHYEAFPVVTLLLTATILFVNGRRTRRLLHDAVEGRVRAARLSRFFAPEIADQLALRLDSPLSGGRRLNVVILFIDIRGFSNIAQTVTPEELGRLLAEFRQIVAGTVREYRGVVDKFIGDGVMAVFGFPEPRSDSAEAALACASMTIDRIAEWSAERARSGKPEIEIGIGAHYGEAFVGVIGREGLLEFTVIGDTVNVAERLERETRPLDASIAVSRPFYDAACASHMGRSWVFSPGRFVRGRQDPLDTYYLPRSEHAVRASSEKLRMGSAELTDRS